MIFLTSYSNSFSIYRMILLLNLIIRNKCLFDNQGGWEMDESIKEAALRETLEEAGVRGIVEVHTLINLNKAQRITTVLPTHFTFCIMLCYAMIYRRRIGNCHIPFQSHQISSFLQLV